MMYICPKCKGTLVALSCEKCGVTYPLMDGIPCFLPGPAGDERYAVRDLYDDIYSHHEDVWAEQGRSEVFISFFAGLVRSLSHATLLEVGCGKGRLLAALPGQHKFGVDPSIHALARAKKRSGASFAVASAEELPFPTHAFDIVVS